MINVGFPTVRFPFPRTRVNRRLSLAPSSKKPPPQSFACTCGGPDILEHLLAHAMDRTFWSPNFVIYVHCSLCIVIAQCCRIDNYANYAQHISALCVSSCRYETDHGTKFYNTASTYFNYAQFISVFRAAVRNLSRHIETQSFRIRHLRTTSYTFLDRISALLIAVTEPIATKSKGGITVAY